MPTSARPRISDKDSLCQFLEVGGHEVKLYPIVMGMQDLIVSCFEAAMTAVVVQGPRQVEFARNLHDHAVISLSNINRARRFLEYQKFQDTNAPSQSPPLS